VTYRLGRTKGAIKLQTILDDLRSIIMDHQRNEDIGSPGSLFFWRGEGGGQTRKRVVHLATCFHTLPANCCNDNSLIFYQTLNQ
jgi:hypothetical protein